MSSIPWPEVVVSRWSIWLRIVTQDITPIQAQRVSVFSKAPCDVRAVARLWDGLPVQGTIICGMSRRSQVWGMLFVFRIKFVWDVSQRLKIARCFHLSEVPQPVQKRRSQK